MPDQRLPNARRVLLLRQGLVFAEGEAQALPEALLEAVDLEFAALGFAASTRLRQRLASLSPRALAETRDRVCGAIAASLGADRKHEPLFRRFPEGIPADTHALWLRKVLGHFLQAPNQPCLFCRRVGTTHVLSCEHVVCDRCFDGASYSACPVCEHHVDRGSPFFQPSPDLAAPQERVTFKLLDLGDDLEASAEAYFRSLVARQQPMSPADVDDLRGLVTDLGARALDWLPVPVPVRETVAIALATAVQAGATLPLETARTHLRTATDVLRFIVACSGADPSLQGEERRNLASGEVRTVYRFKVARLPRTLRKTLLGLLEALPEASLMEDMQRHPSHWVWVGKFLHPGEYAERFPRVLRAFEVVRKRRPDGTRVPPYRSHASRVEAALRHDPTHLVTLLAERPGDLGRRLDHALRTLSADPTETAHLQAAFQAALPALTTPMLLTLLAHLPTRLEPAPQRVYWPKGKVARAVFGPDARVPLEEGAIAPLIPALEDELLRRFAESPAIDTALLDEALKQVPVPFNERTAARGAIAMPRGASIPIPPGKHLRLFLHWCQPEGAGNETDLDLSVGFYAADWSYQGVCSYYQLAYDDVARSAGDLRDAPFPDGATEFVDVDLDAARRKGLRYAVAVVSAYAGLAFDDLERAFAGLMLRDDPAGLHFDPRTVALQFALTGQHGLYLPLVVDLVAGRLHWLDLYSRGRFEFNNVNSANRAITVLAPRMLRYFGSGVRPSMYDLALLHAAARAERVCLRGAETRCLSRDGATPRGFLDRLRTEPGVATAAPPTPDFAALLNGDLALPEGSTRYILFPSAATGNVAAADLLS